MPASTRHRKTFKMAKNKRKQISFHSSKYISHLQIQSFYFHRADIQSMQFIANLAKKTIQSLWAFTKFDVAE